ncbi:MAG: FkbM family methyltransferase [Thermodesulfobacteriota bacterium]
MNDSIKIINDINVTVPASLQLMTPYVLHEQNDWFEDEIKFLRTFIKPGMQVIDIGANYGLYTLTVAKLIGDQGKIWAFEPTQATAACLKQSISHNNFTNIELIQAGLSDQIKKAKFFTGANSELNSLSKESVSGEQHETVLLLTLDHCAKKYDWRDIDFIKLDAEGEESRIVKKGRKFLSAQSPLIMFELKHGEQVNLFLINSFKKLGYESYRLIPGLNVLVPFNPAEPFDDYLLNLFCCKDDKAALLESEGVMVRHWEKMDCPPETTILQDYLTEVPFGKSLGADLIDCSKISKDYLEILTRYILAQSQATSVSEKVGHLLTAIHCLLKVLENGEQNIGRLAAFSRIAFAAGARSLGVKILSYLINKYGQKMDFEINEPVLPASSRYDSFQPDHKIKEWLFSSILEQYIIKHAFSSYFTRRQSLPQLELLSNLGFMDEDMKRRKEMIESCFPA